MGHSALHSCVGGVLHDRDFRLGGASGEGEHQYSFSFIRPSLKLSDSKVYEPSIRAHLGTAAYQLLLSGERHIPSGGVKTKWNTPSVGVKKNATKLLVPACRGDADTESFTLHLLVSKRMEQWTTGLRVEG